MKPTLHHFSSNLGAIAFLIGLVGCANQASTRSVDGKNPPPPSHVQDSCGILQGDYVLYPAHQVYHSPRNKHFVYLKGGSWVTRSKPAGVTERVLFASPAVRLGSGAPPTFQR